MKFLTSFVLIMLVCYAASLFANETPWWLFALGAFLVGWAVPQHPFKSWLAGFSGAFLLWLVLGYIADTNNGGIMSGKMARILPLEGSAISLLLVSAFIGGLVAGMSSLTGAFLRKKPLK